MLLKATEADNDSPMILQRLRSARKSCNNQFYSLVCTNSPHISPTNKLQHKRNWLCENSVRGFQRTQGLLVHWKEWNKYASFGNCGNSDMSQLSEIQASTTIFYDISSFMIQSLLAYTIPILRIFLTSWWKLSRKLSLKMPLLNEACKTTWDHQSYEGKPLFISFSCTSACKELVFPPAMDLLLSEPWRKWEAEIFL